MFSKDPLRNHVVTSWLPHTSPRSTAVRISSARSVADRNAPANPYQAGQAQKRRDRWLNAMSGKQTSMELSRIQTSPELEVTQSVQPLMIESKEVAKR